MKNIALCCDGTRGKYDAANRNTNVVRLFERLGQDGRARSPTTIRAWGPAATPETSLYGGWTGWRCHVVAEYVLLSDSELLQDVELGLQIPGGVVSLADPSVAATDGAHAINLAQWAVMEEEYQDGEGTFHQLRRDGHPKMVLQCTNCRGELYITVRRKPRLLDKCLVCFEEWDRERERHRARAANFDQLVSELSFFSNSPTLDELANGPLWAVRLVIEDESDSPE